MYTFPHPTFFLRDGRIIEQRKPPRRLTREKGKKVSHFVDVQATNATVPMTVPIEVESVSGVENAWAEIGFCPEPPRVGNRVLTSIGEYLVTSGTVLRSAARPDCWLAMLDYGLEWVNRRSILPIWYLATPAAE